MELEIRRAFFRGATASSLGSLATVVLFGVLGAHWAFAASAILLVIVWRTLDAMTALRQERS